MINTDFNDIILYTERLILKSAGPEYSNAMANYYRKNREHFKPAISGKYEHLEQHGLMLQRNWKEFDGMAEKKFLRLLIFEKEDELLSKIIGDIALLNVNPDGRQSAEIAFKMDIDYTGLGYMNETMSATLNFVFGKIGLIRIVAYVLQENERSLKLLGNFGFRHEGIARNLGEYNGERRDYLQFSLLKQDLDERE